MNNLIKSELDFLERSKAHDTGYLHRSSGISWSPRRRGLCFHLNSTTWTFFFFAIPNPIRHKSVASDIFNIRSRGLRDGVLVVRLSHVSAALSATVSQRRFPNAVKGG